MFFKSVETNRKNLNFSEYQFKGNYNRCFALPNFSFGKTTLKNNIMSNLEICSQRGNLTSR